MKRKSFALILAAALLAGTCYTASAGAPPDVDEPTMDESRDFGPRFGGRHEGPRGWHRGGPDRDDWRGGPGHRGKRGMHHGDFGIGFGGAHAFEMLDLDASQKTKMIDVLTNNFRARLEAKMAMVDAQRKLRDLYEDDNANADAIVAANAAVGEARGKLDVLSRKFRDDMKGVLTEEQIKKLDDMKDDRPFGPRGDKRPDGPKGPKGPKPGPGPRR